MREEVSVFVTTVCPTVGVQPPSAEADQVWGPWNIRSEWNVVDGRGEPRSVSLSRNDRRPVTATDIRNLPLGEMLSECRREFARFDDRFVGVRLDGTFIEYETIAPLARAGPRRGRPQSADELAAVATIYRLAYANGESVQGAVARAFNVSRSTATKRIMKARAAGLLEGIGRQE